MVANKHDAAYHDGSPHPLVAVHLETQYVAVCHECGWESPGFHRVAFADDAADQHSCDDGLDSHVRASL